MPEAESKIPFPTKRVTRETGRRILAELHKAYPAAVTALAYTSPFELLIAVTLSAQTTDVMVNKVTPDLFATYPTAFELSQAEFDDVDTIIRRLGFHNTKARNIISTAKMLVERHGGVVPNDRAALEALAGVGRKTASVVLSVAFEEAAFAVDTHVFRVSKRLGLSLGKTPETVEKDVTALLPPEQWRHAHHWLILHGRQICKAQGPLCTSCPLNELCPTAATVARLLRAKLAGRRKPALKAKTRL